MNGAPCIYPTSFLPIICVDSSLAFVMVSLYSRCLRCSLSPYELVTLQPPTFNQSYASYCPEYYHTDSSYSCQYSTGSMATHSFPAFLMVYEVLFPIKKCGRSFESSW